MEFKKDDECFTHFVGIEKCKVVKVYPNSNRYKILQGSWERMVTANKVFSTKDELVNDLIKTIDYKISILEKQKQRVITKYK